MDRIAPTNEHACRAGLPSYPYPLEKLVKILAEMPIGMLTAEELDLLDQWVEARCEPIRAAKAKHGSNQLQVFRELGWTGQRKDRTK